MIKSCNEPAFNWYINKKRRKNPSKFYSSRKTKEDQPSYVPPIRYSV